MTIFFKNKFKNQTKLQNKISYIVFHGRKEEFKGGKIYAWFPALTWSYNAKKGKKDERREDTEEENRIAIIMVHGKNDDKNADSSFTPYPYQPSPLHCFILRRGYKA